MAFKMNNPFKQWVGGKPPKQHRFCDEGKVWCEEAGKCLTQEACEDAKGVNGGGGSKMISGSKNQTVIRDKDGKTRVLKSNWSPGQSFKTGK